MESAHQVALNAKHQGLEASIREEMNRPVPDDSILQRLKREKLKIKEELSEI